MYGGGGGVCSLSSPRSPKIHTCPPREQGPGQTVRVSGREEDIDFRDNKPKRSNLNVRAEI